MNISVGLVAIIFFFVGIVTTLLFQKIRKYDGRLIIDGGDYFVAITTLPDKLEKKNRIILKVISKQGRIK